MTRRRLAHAHGNRCQATHWQVARQPQEPQIKHDRSADQDDKPDDVHNLDQRLEPQPLPHRYGYGGCFKPDEPGRSSGLVYQRSSTVWPSMVMRSARISLGSLRLG